VAEDGVLAQALPEDFGTSSQAPPTAADPAEVAASFALERGMLVVRPFEVALPGLKARVEGVIDLYLWALDLTLRRDDGTVLQLVGPLDRPQVRLSAAAGPVHASPAPSAVP
ncbi:MAG TPA: hypothetical protein VK001_11230, partial [Geminicoccaceae bacterium]|nr:hypothetical protein [Geminicoccaceae bacterium]